MSYLRLGARPVTAVADMTGQNTGNWTCVLDQSVIGGYPSTFECYHIFIASQSLAAGFTTCRIMINSYFWDGTLVGQLNGWDPAQPMLLQPGDDVYLLFNIPTTTTPAPTAVCWFRYDPAVANLTPPRS